MLGIRTGYIPNASEIQCGARKVGKIKVKTSLYRPGQTLRAPGG